MGLLFTFNFYLADYVSAESLSGRVVNWRRETLGANHIDTLQAMTVLGTVHTLRCKYEDARMIYQEVLHEYEKNLWRESYRNKKSFEIIYQIIFYDTRN